MNELDFKIDSKLDSEIDRVEAYDVQELRTQFPILQEQVHGKPLVYLDNAATTQKPQSVLDALMHYYMHDNANIHRGVHTLAERATLGYEQSRVKVQEFLNARHAHEVIFVRNATEGVNLVAQTYGRQNIGEGDEILISAMEHHCNIVPWQMLCQEKGAILRVVPMNDAGELDLDAYERLITPRTKFIALVHMSNVLGTINPIRQMIVTAHAHGVPILVDAAQSAYHLPLDVQALDCDFLVLSGHKLYGPTGIGVLYGKEALLNAMPPWMGGGDMIDTVTFERTTYNSLPHKLEAGTPHIAGGIGLGAAVDFLNGLGMDRIAAHEHQLMAYGTEALLSIPALRLIGTAKEKASVLSFMVANIHPHDIGTILDTQGVAVRTGQHCAHPIMQRYAIPGTVRASFACYNTTQEIDTLVAGLHKAIKMLA